MDSDPAVKPTNTEYWNTEYWEGSEAKLVLIFPLLLDNNLTFANKFDL